MNPEDHHEANLEANTEVNETTPNPLNPVPATPVDPTIAQILSLLQKQTAHLTQQQKPSTSTVTFKSFQAINPPEFRGTTDPVEANTWLKEMEKAFELVQLGENQKTVYATYFLKGESNYWWQSTKALENTEVITWARFTELFLEKYFPRYMQTQMELKFCELKQEKMTVAEYEKKFTELARFGPEYVNTDEKRAKRFQQG